jgi:hypothetical protein
MASGPLPTTFGTGMNHPASSNSLTRRRWLTQVVGPTTIPRQRFLKRGACPGEELDHATAEARLGRNVQSIERCGQPHNVTTASLLKTQKYHIGKFHS